MLIALCGWLPAVIIPLATLIQLSTILRNRSAAGVSASTWFLFGVANIGLYVYTEKYGDIQAIAGLLGSAALDFLITGLAIANYGQQPSPSQSSAASTPSVPPTSSSN